MTSMKSLKNDQIFSIRDCISSCNKYKTQIRIRYITYTSRKQGKHISLNLLFSIDTKNSLISYVHR